ncbi:hypothetical protein LZZ85_06375 [Terrimonas sp. NA20]|uniref:Uncharacterized protein n=1 Tax=Terrimonas ginsenosidimutans TaxID=2908004 RepID=A0ABS9KNJ1_9BACT|nr:hypothetical protein [Terrimonas ginsenosidimutans]MCG2613897.1 hypothetical protein [Terrimonas ginsenosidimutans]
MIFRRNILIISGSILMIMMLLWLTISAPFVGASMQLKAKTEKKGNSTSPLAGSEEEKVSSSPSSTANEYLHENEELQHASTTIVTSYRTHHITAYIAFHGELVSPPPKA